MTSAPLGPVRARLEAAFGVGTAWPSEAGGSAVAWEMPAYHLVWAEAAPTETALRKMWEARKGRQAYPVVVLAPADDAATVRVAGPQDARPVRELPADRVLDLLETSHGVASREAAALLTREFTRLEDAVVPGLRVKDLLTPHFVRTRLRASANEQRLRTAVADVRLDRGTTWRPLLQVLGYAIGQLPQHGYLLRAHDAPVAVVHPYNDAAHFSRLTDNGELPEGLVSRSGTILHREDLPALRLIDPQAQAGCPIPDGLDLERLFATAAADICATHNALLDPAKRFASLPASQRWALDALRSPDAPAGDAYDAGDRALSVGRNNVVWRELSALRREHDARRTSLPDCARRIVDLVERFGLHPVAAPKAPAPITEDDIGVVCYQVVVPG